MTPRVWTLSTPIRRHPGVAWRGFDSELALLDPALGRLSTLNEVAARCWQLADGRSLGELLDQLLNEFEVERNVLERDVRTFLDQLSQRGWLDP